MENIHKLAENLVNLTVLECYELVKMMKDEYGIEPNFGTNYTEMYIFEPVVEVEQTHFDVVLKTAGMMNKLGVIKAIKEMTGKSLLEIKKLVDEAPNKIKEQVSKDEALALQSALMDLGAAVEIV